MNTKVSRGVLLGIFFLVAVLLAAIGFSTVPAIHSPLSIYYPLMNNLIPVGKTISNKLVITEIMVNPEGSEPGGEWIEIFNRSSEKIDLGGFKIGDSELQGDREGMYSFIEGTLILPGRTIIIANQSVSFYQSFGIYPDFELSDSDPETADLLKYKEWSGGPINLNNSGDEVLLLNQDDELLDVVSWGDSGFAFDPPAPETEDGTSLERNPANVDSNRADDWLILQEPEPGRVNLNEPPLPVQTPTTSQIPCDQNGILISEIFYDPELSPEPGGEWIELFNPGAVEIDLECILVGDEETSGGGEGMMAFPPESKIFPEQVIVIANRADIFEEGYGFFPDFEFIDSNDNVPNLLSYPQWAAGSIGLSNSGDEVLLISLSTAFIDVVSWGNSDFAFKPPVPGAKPGYSISRQPADIDTNSAQDWVELANPQPGLVMFSPPEPSVPPTSTPSPKPPSPTEDLSPSATPTRTGTATRTATMTATETTTPTQTMTPTQEIKLVINEIHADPHPEFGDANFDGIVDFSGDEFVEIVNCSPDEVDLSNWSLSDMLETRHVFPEGTVLPPNCGIVIFGDGYPSGNFGGSLIQKSSSGELSLNNQMETIYLYNSQHEVAFSLSYGEEASDDQSITRDPDLTGTLPLRKHSLAAGSAGALYSPGTLVTGEEFSGCPD